MSSLCDPNSRSAVIRWLRSSPDHTIYHLAPYIDFVRKQNGVADVLLISRDGNALFALPVHSWDGAGIDSGYSGVVFPSTRSERILRRSVTGLAALLAANRHFPFRMRQSAQAPAYDDLSRVTLLQQLLESEGLVLDPVYGRLCDLDYLPDPQVIPVASGRHHPALRIDDEWLTGEVLSAYDPSTRNQIRQAIRNGLTVEYLCGGDVMARTTGYAQFQPLHEESWRRTGLLPKPLEHWLKLSESIATSGGEDLIVLVLDSEGVPQAGVLCHAYQSRAIYWSGCSSAAGLSSRANPLCLHGAIVAARLRGVRTFELGRFRADETSSKERSVTDYKSQFGGSLVRITSFSSTPSLRARARAARAAAVFEGRRRLAVEIGRARARRALSSV
jgi:Acetyltransferase (GNAT) domain